MPRRKAKKGVKRMDDKSDTEIQREENKEEFVDEDVERQIAAIKAIRDAEIEHTLTALRLLRSCLTEEQRKTPVLDFFKENLPGLSIDCNDENGEMELKWDDKNGDSLRGNVDGFDFNYSILKHLSMGFPECSRPSLGGYDLPDNLRASLLGTGNPNLEDLVFQGTSESQMLASHDAFQTPGVNGQRLSFGMTPKTRRQPKPGEMMLSVHGSPLGVYEEDNNLGDIKEESS